MCVRCVESSSTAPRLYILHILHDLHALLPIIVHRKLLPLAGLTELCQLGQKREVRVNPADVV
jgi:hypothetical protein